MSDPFDRCIAKLDLASRKLDECMGIATDIRRISRQTTRIVMVLSWLPLFVFLGTLIWLGSHN